MAEHTSEEGKAARAADVICTTSACRPRIPKPVSSTCALLAPTAARCRARISTSRDRSAADVTCTEWIKV